MPAQAGIDADIEPVHGGRMDPSFRWGDSEGRQSGEGFGDQSSNRGVGGFADGAIGGAAALV